MHPDHAPLAIAAARRHELTRDTQPDIHDQIQRLRNGTSQIPGVPVPVGQRSTDASQRARLTAALQRNQAWWCRCTGEIVRHRAARHPTDSWLPA